MADGLLDFKPLITHRFILDEINRALAKFTGREGGAIKVLVKP
jgi:threonine dehydrogenase-like Zn-dependent dehydrogenase